MNLKVCSNNMASTQTEKCPAWALDKGDKILDGDRWVTIWNIRPLRGNQFLITAVPSYAVQVYSNFIFERSLNGERHSPKRMSHPSFLKLRP
jgi:hypothetical protein